MEQLLSFLKYLFVIALGIGGLYVLLFYSLRFIFRKFERDFALVTLYVSAYPALAVFMLGGLKFAIAKAKLSPEFASINQFLTTAIIITASYWAIQLFSQVVIYYLKELAEQTEVMWDDVLIPILEGVVPIAIVLTGISLILQLSFDVDLTGIWVALGGASFIIGFAAKDILANFFSGIVLLIDTPFQFGDVISLEKGQLGIIKKVGLRVTQLYLFETHTEAYIPNSVLQGQMLLNMSRPILPVYYSRSLVLKPEGDLDAACDIIQEIIYAHPDTMGDIATKLDCMDAYFNWDNPRRGFVDKKNNGRERLIAENKVNQKLEEIEQSLEVIAVTIEFVERGGLSKDEIETIQQEFQFVLDLLGLEVIVETAANPDKFWQRQTRKQTYQLKETNTSDSLISLVRDWYRIWLKDPDLGDTDRNLLPTKWEYKIKVLKRRTQSLQQKVRNPSRVETRLDDFVKELNTWLQTRFKQRKSQLIEPDVRLDKTVYGSASIFIQLSLDYFVDDITLENCDRGDRVNSEIYREIMKHLKDLCGRS